MKTRPETSRSRSPWPWAIVGWFVVFAGAMAAWIVYAVRQDMDLVRDDYYQEEVLYQQQLDRMNRTQPLRGEVRVSYDASRHAITVALPAMHARQKISGRIQLYRPSDAKLDVTVPLSVSADGTQRIDAKNLRAGLWKVRLQWTADGQEYFLDEPIVVAGI